MHYNFQVFNSHQSKDGKMRDICDGELFKESQFFQEHPNGLQIHFYYDDVEVCNPLGSKAKVHKLGIDIHTDCWIRCISLASL